MKTSAVMLAVAVFATSAFAQGASAASDWKGPEAASGTYFALIHNKFDFKSNTAYQRRGPLYLIAGKFMPDAEQPIWFKAPKLFAPRPNNNSFYTSYTVQNGKGVLWFNDVKFFIKE